MLRILFSIVLVSFLNLAANPQAPQFPPASMDGQLIIHNRILAKINGKSLSVMDVVKKMDVFINEHYPELCDSSSMKFQFYSAHWKATLDQMIDSELMIADSEKLDLKISDAEVREKIHERFGPNVIKTLDKLSLSYEEARKMVWTDLVVQRMNWFRIYSKALQNVNTADLKKAYGEFSKLHPPVDEWEYEVLSVKSSDKELGFSFINHAASLLATTKAGLKAAADTLAASDKENLNVTVSDVITADSKNISEAHLKVLTGLPSGGYSEPIAQVNRITGEIVHRIFHLLAHKKQETPPFQVMAERLKEELIQKEAQRISKHYLQKLRKRYGFDEKYMKMHLPDDFQPFAIVG